MPLLAASAVVAAAAIALWMRGFTVDDALISVRYARHLAAGVGYRFDADAPSTDGVTPLPWPFVLAPLARGDALAVLGRAKGLSLLAWLVAAAGWGRAVARAEAPAAAKGGAIALLAVCLPVAAHAVSGMETGLAIALATFASIAERALVVALLAGLAASLRPEMAPWAVALAIGAGPRDRAIPRALVAIAPFAACVAARLVAFGHPAPLAVMAKPSDVEHGLVYAGAAAVASLAPIAACAPIALARVWDRATAIAVAGAVHFAAIVAVGGDWMPYARLAAPIAPSLLYAFVLASPRMNRPLAAARVALAFAVGAYVLVVAAPAGRRVEANVVAIVARARPLLAGARRIAALDVGWPSAATDASIVDLAGLTDPAIAALPGGHTSKRVDPAFFLARDPDVLLVYRDADGRSRVVEVRLVASELVREKYEARAFLPWGEDGAGYEVWVRR